MATYLVTAYKDRERVKSLGARWDASQKRWFVPEGISLVAFAAWLPVEGAVVAQATAELDLRSTDIGGELQPARGVPLSALLNGVADTLAAAYRTGVWTIVEVSRVDVRGPGHVYLEVAERDAGGAAVAQARAMIWARTANQVLPAFEQATGAVLAAGIKLLVRARPTMHPVYGLSLEIDAIDPDFTLGDLAARKREIRARLKAEGLFDRNRQLPSPWDYQAVLVVAPQGAAGLGDFQAESERLQRLGVCRFVYVTSRFQGEGAAEQIRTALQDALTAWRAEGPDPDAVCIIRGGGPANDLAWLDDYALARWICECDVPVLTGIGHERDETVLDEVAHCAYDTPSKAIGGIENVIRRRASEAEAAFNDIVGCAVAQAQLARRDTQELNSTVQQGAAGQLQKARHRSAQLLADLRLHGSQRLGHASELIGRMRLGVAHEAASAVVRARQGSSTAMAEISGLAHRFVLLADTGSRQQWATIVERAQTQVGNAKDGAALALQTLHQESRRALATARDRSESLVREIAGQGPQKALRRGLAIVRTDGKIITSANQLKRLQGSKLELQFHDGEVRIIKAEES